EVGRGPGGRGLRAGQEVAAEGLLRPDGSFATTSISQNGTFSVADSAAGNQSVPGREPACGNSREMAICTGQTAGGASGGTTTTPPAAPTNTVPPATPPAPATTTPPLPGNGPPRPTGHP